MPEVTYTKAITADADAIWAYVSEMSNWAPFIMGYKQHDEHDDKRSSWTVKGEIGVLARTVSFDVLITEWREPECVRFSLTGTTENFEGQGTFLIGVAPLSEATPPRPVSRFRRFWQRLRRKPIEVAPATVADPSGQTTLSFELTMQAGGMTGPVVNAMIEPLMHRAAEDLADNLSREIVTRTGGPSTAAAEPS
jgi:carbon monoxide dehydrogenase subunit G